MQPLPMTETVQLPSIADFERRRQVLPRANRNDLVVEIPVALLDIFERETVLPALPLSRSRTNPNAGTAALRIRKLGLESRSRSLSSLVAGGRVPYYPTIF